jgi:hypothetical protein
VASTFLTSLRNDERANHQLDVKFQESYLKQVVAVLKCQLAEGAVGSKDGDGESDGDKEKEKEEKPSEEVEEGELPDTQGKDADLFIQYYKYYGSCSHLLAEKQVGRLSCSLRA